MILEEQFQKEFDKIAASFGRNWQKKHIDEWYQEIQERDPEIFKKTCYKLRYGLKFPTFGMFQETYMEMKTQANIGKKIDQGCDLCVNRMVIWEEGDKGYSGHCSICYETDIKTIDPHLIAGNPKLKLHLKAPASDSYVSSQAVIALCQLISADYSDLENITPNETIEAAEGLNEIKIVWQKEATRKQLAERVGYGKEKEADSIPF